MKTSDFSFDLPEELIAQFPAEKRGTSRLLVLNRQSGEIEHKLILDFPGLLDRDTFVVFNNSRVRKARIYGTSKDGSRVEFLLLEKREENLWLAMVSKTKKQRPGKTYVFDGGLGGEITGSEDSYRLVRFEIPLTDEYLDLHGHIPLPPYIRREDAPVDADRYQTVYSRPVGSVAAPTAGLHFTPELMEQITAVCAGTAVVTLHVGLGTFLPVRTDSLNDHSMHTEHYSISVEAASAVDAARASGKRILAVGTTTVRTLESAFKDGRLSPGEGSTDIFIYPGYKFQVVDQLLTNFHTPRSTLLMLVSALAGRETILNAYEEAVKERYRFFSYGDAMFIK